MFSTNIDDLLYYTDDHYSEADNLTYYDSHESHIYKSFNADTNKDKIESSSTPVTVETKDPDYEKQPRIAVRGSFEFAKEFGVARNTLALAPNTSLIASSGSDGEFNVWNLGTGKHLKKIEARSSINKVLFDFNLYLLVIGTDTDV